MTGLIAALLLASAPANQFVKANGVTLQYVDWGGRGETILFLPGLGDDVHRFDPFAPRFIDRFHVIGFSRRGQGESEVPADNYSTETLVEDIRAFLDSQHIDRVELIGHSIAGVEMTRFAVKYPARVRHLVYLDAAYDMGAARDAAIRAQLIAPDAKPGPFPLDRIEAAASTTHLAYSLVNARALAFFIINKPVGEGKWYKAFELGYKSEQIAIFKRDMKRGQVVEFRDTDHFFFNDPNKVDGVVSTVRAFLSSP